MEMKNTIKAHKNFDFKDAKSVPMPAFFMKFRTKRKESSEYGLVASKRIFPKAVSRNRAKRLLRVWIREIGLIPGFDMIFIARAGILETKDGAEQMKRAMKKVKHDRYDLTIRQKPV